MMVTASSLVVLSDARLLAVRDAFINSYELVRDQNEGSRVAAAASPVGGALHVIEREVARRGL